MESCVEAKIKKMGYRVNTKPYGYIDVANMWYRNEIIDDFHKRTTIQGEVCIDFDDSYVEDKTTQMSNMRADAMSFSDIPEFMIRYLMMSLNIERDEAEKILDSAQEEPDPEEED